MFAPHRNFLRKAVTEAVLTIALFGTAALTSSQTAVTAIRSTSGAPAPARSTVELQALILRDCRDIDYARVDGFEGMLSDFVCGA